MTDWRHRAALGRKSAQEAAALPKEPAGALPRTALTAAIAVWSAMFAVAVIYLPEQVPIHWSAASEGFSRADNWASKPAALGFLAMAFVSVMALTLLPRIVVRIPELINSPHRDWWMASGVRLVRYERLLREDLMLIIAATVTLLTGIGIQVILAARTPGGATATWVFWALLGIYLAAIALVLARMIGGRRYRPEVASA